MLTLTEPDRELWERFQGGRIDRSAGDHPVLARWSRARALGAPAARELQRRRLDAQALQQRRARMEPILARSQELLEAAAGELRRRGCALLLADDDGVILASRGAEAFAAPLRAGLAEGVRWNEAERGTNAIGTALAESRPVVVVGRAHYDPAAHDLVCYGAPVRDPTGRPVAALDITGPLSAADPLLGVLVQSLAASIEGVLHAEALARVLAPQEPDRGASRDPFAALVGDDPALTRVREQAARFARCSLPILLLSETGTGKELLARAIHRASGRADGPFVALNCAAVPASLLESELFGHAPGAFTGAAPGGATGKVGAADGGTLFLDEIADTPPALQAALLRVLEDGSYSRVGEPVQRRADFRLVAATCRDLDRLVDEGRFRRDLYFRIRGAVLVLPPVRARRDLEPLARTLLAEVAAEEGLAEVPALAPDLLAAIASRQWPGNVRELKTALHHAVVLAGGDRLAPHHLPPVAGGATPQAAGGGREAAASAALAAGGARAAAEAAALREALRVSGGNLSRAARHLGVARSTLYRMMERHRI